MLPFVQKMFLAAGNIIFEFPAFGRKICGKPKGLPWLKRHRKNANNLTSERKTAPHAELKHSWLTGLEPHQQCGYENITE
jgi:hypothetical protein